MDGGGSEERKEGGENTALVYWRETTESVLSESAYACSIWSLYSVLLPSISVLDSSSLSCCSDRMVQLQYSEGRVYII